MLRCSTTCIIAGRTTVLISNGRRIAARHACGRRFRIGSHEDAGRGTDGFSSEKFTKVRYGYVRCGNQARAAEARPPAAPPAEPNGSEILVRCLQLEGVKHVWGYPGGAVLYIYDALYKQDTIEHVLVRHEQAAVHAADGYARASGDVGVALVTSGPGVTNAVTGIATAYMDSIPMVIITGQVPTPAIGLDAFQECDTVGITRPIVKHNFLVKDVRDLAMTMKKAFHIARTGRPGPVVVDIPKDVSHDKTPFTTRAGRDALVQPGEEGPRRADPQGGAG